MTDAEKREASRQLYYKWKNKKGREDEDDRSFWLDILQRVMGIDDATDRVEFQKKVIVDGHTKKIDAYIKETRVLIEQKSSDIPLDKKIPQSGGIMLTPYEQAKRYNDNLPVSEKARWIVTSNFSEIWIYNMDTAVPEKDVQCIYLKDLPDKYSTLNFLLEEKVQKITQEMELSLKAGELVGKIYDKFLAQYNNPQSKESQSSLNVLCVRIVFCLYAEDAGLFGAKDAFIKYLGKYDNDMRSALINLFKVLDTPEENRPDLYLSDDLAAFPYVNGGLFANESIIIPRISQEIKEALTEAALFDWSKISPTIFGAVFESTLNPETRRSGGMHYTSIENIHKVIDPLFLSSLTGELNEIIANPIAKTKEIKLKAFQEKLAGLKFLDPAAGSGNFLTETYISLRRLENRVIGELHQGQMQFDLDVDSPIKVGISQFHGIEINDFAVTVAKTALWIAESQMMKETEDIIYANLDFLPLKTNANIVEGNALRIDWNEVVPATQLDYIIGNPPFVGARLMSKEQKDDLLSVFGKKWKNAGNLDYVSCWYKKAIDLMQGTNIRAALVSTNSVSQGDSVATLWKPLFEQGVHFDFAHSTFRWDSEASIKAHVHCVIIGFSTSNNTDEKFIYNGDNKLISQNINPYLIDTENIFVESRNKPLCDIPDIGIGNKPIDGGNYLFTKEEMLDFIKKEPSSEKWFKPWYGSQEFINRKSRYCLWLGNCPPDELRKMPECMKRVQAVIDFRLASTSAGTVKLAEKPTHFHVENMPNTEYIVIPRVSSERRRYVPIGFLTPDIICSDSVHIIPNATIYHFGILTSNVHMAWMRTVCGRLEMRYRYSKDIVYNNFPWPAPSDAQKAKIEQTAQAILDARALYPTSSLADLYDPLTMPIELRKAHTENDKAVMKAYGMDIKETSEADCVAELMKMYQEMVKV